ncbi:MAG: hypothetical protein K0S57_2633 [Ramlibacter sp.]|nr:hypothetical protein [Ramlibacter sp.]
MRAIVGILAAILASAATAQDDDHALGQQLAQCAAILVFVQSAPASFNLAISKADASTVSHLAMLETYALLGRVVGKAAIQQSVPAFRARLEVGQADLTAILNAEGKRCAELALAKFEELKPRMNALENKQ